MSELASARASMASARYVLRGTQVFCGQRRRTGGLHLPKGPLGIALAGHANKNECMEQHFLDA
jgi:hypothetical protein